MFVDRNNNVEGCVSALHLDGLVPHWRHVSSTQPEWTDQDLNVRYKPTEWISKDEFILPVSSELCLLVPKYDESSADSNDDVITDLNTLGKYIVVHKDDIVDIGAKNKRDGNYSEFASSYRRVLVRASRALFTGSEDDIIKVSTVGSDHFLTLPHRRPHHAQIDLEARADENQLIRVGSAGSIITVVADNSRRTRSVITIQATNKGLAAARFRVKARDCGPEMASILSGKVDELIAGPSLLPPRHTQRFRLELPTEIPVDVVHCSVALINDDDESVAVRDVAIKKGDRCFCVWHCDCVCLNEDPKLLCREMTETRQVAAGLSPRERARRARSACYPDVVTVNLFVVAVGVIIGLLMLGFLKGCLGLVCRCISKWGIYKMIQVPRKLDHYYEPALRGRTVVYDDEGWPIHPDSKKRNVSLVPRVVEFILNVIFFVTVPCLMLYDVLKKMLCRSSQQRCCSPPEPRDHKKCFSTRDLQMRPLLLERHRAAGEAASSCVDSEQDDTEYVLMQMQKSKESLARSQKKLNESGASSATARKLSLNDYRQN
ncbi:hypothetical protein ABMA27_011693 [Loxostege sticticalis]|uniref:Generative cell specific-1/HAP2 domain-containing protein n=1 Tax=Loxostege sticticalis TaxID=481309 RepID=A0ABR3IH72_LOXSC